MELKTSSFSQFTMKLMAIHGHTNHMEIYQNPMIQNKYEDQPHQYPKNMKLIAMYMNIDSHEYEY